MFQSINHEEEHIINAITQKNIMSVTKITPGTEEINMKV